MSKRGSREGKRMCPIKKKKRECEMAKDWREQKQASVMDFERGVCVCVFV